MDEAKARLGSLSSANQTDIKEASTFNPGGSVYAGRKKTRDDRRVSAMESIGESVFEVALHSDMAVAL